MKSKSKLTITTLVIFILFSSIAHSTSTAPDYMQGVNVAAMDTIYNKIKNYDKKQVATQSIITLDSSCKFKDHTTINCVKVNPDDKKRTNKIAITIDDSFSDKYTSDILEVLDKHNCKATFFITYKLINANPDRIYDILKRGHEIGSHSTTHAPFRKLHTLRKQWEIETFNTWFTTLTSAKISLFRFPTGSYDNEAIDMMVNYKLYPIGWSIDTRDWELKNLKKIYDATIKEPVKSGDIVLLHNGYPFSKELFDKILTYYESKGFSFLKVSDLIYINNFKVENGVQTSNSIIANQ